MTGPSAKYVRPHYVGVLIDWRDENSMDYAIKLIAHKGFDKLLCDHVYFGLCGDCPQTRCERRCL